MTPYRKLRHGTREGGYRRFAAAAPPSTLLDGLVSYWALDEESGTRVDAVGDNDLTDNNTTGSDTGVNENAAKFVAANVESLSVDPTPAIWGDTGWSISWWQKVANATENRASDIICAYDSNVTFIVRIGYQADTNSRHELYVGNGAGAFDITQQNNAYVLGEDTDWHHYAVVRSGNNIKWYRDGSTSGWAVTGGLAPLDYSITLPNNYTSTDTPVFSVGDNATVGNRAPFGGLIDEVALWSRALIADEIAELYNGGDGFFYPFT